MALTKPGHVLSMEEKYLELIGTNLCAEVSMDSWSVTWQEQTWKTDIR